MVVTQPYKPEYLPRQIEALNYLATDCEVEQLLYGGAAGVVNIFCLS